MKIVAFMQNQWFKNPERVKATIARTIEKEAARGTRDAQAVREYYIAAFLFMGCLTVRRLKMALGEDLCDSIIWEEQSPEIGGKSSSVFPPDFVHIRRVLGIHDPSHVVAFGVHAQGALLEIQQRDQSRWKLILAPHPAARQENVMERLKLVPLALQS